MSADKSEDVLQLLSCLQEDAGGSDFGISNLLERLGELSQRVAAAELASDPRLHSAHGKPKDKRSSLRSPSASSIASEERTDSARSARRTSLSQGRGGLGSTGRSSTSHAFAHIKVEDSQLPKPPDATSTPLPPPGGGHEWEALQAAVNDAVDAFSEPSAKMRWKKWALTQSHSCLVVSLFWWTVAAAFRPDHGFASPIQDYCFGHFCRHYVTHVLRLKGKMRDLYQQVWISMLGRAVLYLLSEVHPRSSHKFDGDLLAFITKQLRLWTAGALPSDLHPSVLGGAQDVSPAAFSFAQPGSINAVGSQPAGSGPRTSGTPPGTQHAQHTLPTPAPGTPPVPSAAQAAYIQAALKDQQRRQQRLAGQPPAPPTAQSHTSTSHGPMPTSPLFSQAPPHTPISLSSAYSARGGSFAAAASMAAAVAAVSSTADTDSAAAAAPALKSVKTQSFVTSKASPALVSMLGDGIAVNVVKGLHKTTLGQRPYMRRALDEGDGDFSYKRMANKALANATDAVAAYEATKRAVGAEVRALRRTLSEQHSTMEQRVRTAMGAGGARIKDMSNRLATWHVNQNAKDQGAPPVREAVHRKEASQINAPLRSLCLVENAIMRATSGERVNSLDAACHVAAEVAREGQVSSARWRPLATERVGTKDMKRTRAARSAMLTVDFRRYE